MSASTTLESPPARKAQHRRARRGKHLDQAFDPDANCFGFMRLVFAALVLLSHAFPLGGFDSGIDPAWKWSNGQQDFGAFAVAGFFVVSGFLVTRSFLTSSTSVRYLWKRVLRIFPGFWVCLVVTVAVFGILAFKFEHGSLHGYLNGNYPDHPGDYVRRNALLTMNQYGINGLLGGIPWPHAFDGSLWTLMYEFKCYLAVMVLGIFGILQRARLAVLGITILLWITEIGEFYRPNTVKHVVPLFADIELVHLAFMFSLGACLWLFREKVPINGWVAGAALGGFLLGSSIYGWFDVISEVCFAYLCLWFAVRVPIRNFDRFGDFSYGLYVYAFPVEQLASLYGVNKWGLPAYLAVTFPIAMGFAVVSWFVVERSFLNLKRVRLPTIWKPPAWWGQKVQGKPVVAADRIQTSEQSPEGAHEKPPVPGQPVPELTRR